MQLRKTASLTYGSPADSSQQIEPAGVISQTMGVTNIIMHSIKKSTLGKNQLILNNMSGRHIVVRVATSIGKSFRRQDIQCAICDQNYGRSQVVSLTNCSHLFCGECANSFLTYKINSYQQVVCPNEGCATKFEADSELFKNLPVQLQDKYHKFQRFELTKNNPLLKLCTQTDCEGTFNVSEEICQCTLCHTQFCRKCSYVVHEGECQIFHVQFLENNYKYKQCRACMSMVEKNLGCNHITCRCGHQFCYLCGEDWDKDPCKRVSVQPVQPVQRAPDPEFGLTDFLCRALVLFYRLIAYIVFVPLGFCVFLGLVALIIFGFLSVAILFGGFALASESLNKFSCGVIFVILFPFIMVVGIPWQFIQDLGRIGHAIAQVWVGCVEIVGNFTCSN